MQKFYEKFFEVIRNSKAKDVITFKNYLNKEINRELESRKKIGLPTYEYRNIIDKQKNLAIPDGKVKLGQRVKYIQFVIDQKWDYLFSEENLDETPKYYVYAHVDPRKIEYDALKKLNLSGVPFYIGKGCGNRAWDLNRNQGHGVKIKELSAIGYNEKHIVNIVREKITEAEAFQLESKLIYLFKTVYEDVENGILYNIDTGKRPEFDPLPTHGKERYAIKKRESVRKTNNPIFIVRKKRDN